MRTSTPTAIGYYRFTDIFFEWHQALPNPEDVSPLKAILAYNALVHPDHPLRKEGVDGIELFVGTFDNGEARLLFSSAQVEYIRYYIHTMGLTKELIPIPNSDYLITQSSMQSCSPAIYNHASNLKKAIKGIEKNNKRLKGTGTRLASRRLAFERVRTFWSSKKGVWIAIDFESWDRDHTLLLEFGWSAVRFEDGKEIRSEGHWITYEYRNYRNTYVADNKDRYSFGKSEMVKKKDFKQRVAALFDEAKTHGPVFYVFHDPSQDIKTLYELEAPITNLTYVLPDTAPTEGLFVVDTAQLFAALEGETSANTRGLEQIARHLGLSPYDLHNAGNDAHYTMEACKAMASGDPVDAQREKRWPLHISATQPKAVFREDNDEPQSDQEDIM
ncbi:hypothetical protein EIP91_006671 [Steccherinum ochraceum]|uniref:Gfd2/YDR514C-like C-terminal domain-containing protein n=1 Tax=Steccherinum ochraceum TaxID=92696 RepID=A0A4R0S104_9APHY|nr:hypothetical protein EIP91_006671 [Steccherinum ochraceum]